MAKTTFFSFKPLGPIAPGSSPPWPGSMTTTILRLMLDLFCGVALGRVSSGLGIVVCAVTVVEPSVLTLPLL